MSRECKRSVLAVLLRLSGWGGSRDGTYMPRVDAYVTHCPERFGSSVKQSSYAWLGRGFEQVFRKERHDIQADMFAFGLLMFEVFSRELRSIRHKGDEDTPEIRKSYARDVIPWLILAHPST
jgi:hypothetical protein